jgi:hypothetical protein
MKPGYRTTEFWVTLLGQGIALLATLGVLAAPEAATLTEAAGKLVTAAFTLASSTAVVLHYVQSRTRLKEKQS